MSASAGINATIVGSPAISFYNDTRFIRVDNSSTGATSYIPKATLNFSSDSTTSLTLVTEGLKVHYLFADVARPVVASVKALLETLQAWVEDSEGNREASPFVSDVTTTVAEVKTFYTKDALRVDDLQLGGGVSTHDGGRNAVLMSVSTSQTSRVLRQTYTYAIVNVMKTSYAVVGATLITDTSVRNTVAKAGIFDDNIDTINSFMQRGNGVFFQWRSGEGLSLVLRSNYSGAQVDVTVQRADWNLDALDGSGPSSRVLDPTAENTYVFEVSAFGGSVVRAGYMQDGGVIWCHRFVNVRLGCASLPLRWEIGRIDRLLETSANDAASMLQGAGSIFIQGLDDVPVVTRSVSSTAVRSVTAATGPAPVFFMMNRSSVGHVRLLLRRLTIANLDQGVARWSLVKNSWNGSLTLGTLVAVPDSYVLYTTGSTGGNPGAGYVVASGFVGSGITTHDLDDKGIYLQTRFSGTSDNLILYVQYLRGVVTVVPSVEWIEVE